MTPLTTVLDISADIAAILTAIVAVLFYVALQIGRYTQRHELSAYLKNLPADSAGRHHRRSIAQIQADLWMSEAEVFEAARGNKQLWRGLDGGDAPTAARLWLRWPDSN